MPKQTITIELEVDVAQEVMKVISKKARDIDWVLDKTPPREHEKVAELDNRAKLLTLAATQLSKLLKTDSKVVEITTRRKK